MNQGDLDTLIHSKGPVLLQLPDKSQATFSKLQEFGKEGLFYIHYKSHPVNSTGSFRSDLQWSIVGSAGKVATRTTRGGKKLEPENNTFVFLSFLILCFHFLSFVYSDILETYLHLFFKGREIQNPKLEVETSFTAKDITMEYDRNDFSIVSHHGKSTAKLFFCKRLLIKQSDFGVDVGK